MALSVVAHYLHRKADDCWALGEEHCAFDDPAKFYVAIEVTVRELAEAIEQDELEAA